MSLRYVGYNERKRSKNNRPRKTRTQLYKRAKTSQCDYNGLLGLLLDETSSNRHPHFLWKHFYTKIIKTLVAKFKRRIFISIVAAVWCTIKEHKYFESLVQLSKINEIIGVWRIGNVIFILTVSGYTTYINNERKTILHSLLMLFYVIRIVGELECLSSSHCGKVEVLLAVFRLFAASFLFVLNYFVLRT